jgi:hypothetical protein
MEITSIKLQEDGYLVNGTISVPNNHSGWMSEFIDEWLETNTPEPEFTEAELDTKALAQVTTAIQKLLDTTAQSYRYDNIMSARSYAGYANQFQEEAKTLAEWSSNCWVKAGEIEAEIKAGSIAIPSVDELLTEIPTYKANESKE